MRNDWLLLDCNNIGRRLLYSMGNLSHEGKRTGVSFGFFRDVDILASRFRTSNIVFCFDEGGRDNIRKSLFAGYKRKRHKKLLTLEEKEIEEDFNWQMTQIKNDYLPRLGFKNIFSQSRYEADDIIGRIVKTYRKRNFYIISSDEDYFQLLRSNCSVYSYARKKVVTKKDFKEEYGIRPRQWVSVKALAGCGSDEIPGVPNVGTKRAIQYLQGNLSSGTKAYINILKRRNVIKRNKKLVSLPYPGTKKFKLMPQRPKDLNAKEWRAICKELGIKTSYSYLFRRK